MKTVSGEWLQVETGSEYGPWLKCSLPFVLQLSTSVPHILNIHKSLNFVGRIYGSSNEKRCEKRLLYRTSRPGGFPWFSAI